MEKIRALGFKTGRILRVLAIVLGLLYVGVIVVALVSGDYGFRLFLPLPAIASPFVSTPLFLQATASYRRGILALLLGLPLQIYAVTWLLPTIWGVGFMYIIVAVLAALSLVHTVCVVLLLVRQPVVEDG